MAAVVLFQLHIDSHRTKGGEGVLLFIFQQIINKTRYNLQSGWLPTDHGPDEKMVLSRCLAALLLPPGQLAPQVSLRPAITQIK